MPRRMTFSLMAVGWGAVATTAPFGANAQISIGLGIGVGFAPPPYYDQPIIP